MDVSGGVLVAMARPIQKRENIERGVVEVVAEKGLGATTIQDIAAAAGVSPGLLYRYWKNRDDLASAVYQQHWYVLLERMAGPAAAETDVLSKIRKMAGAFLEFADEEPVLLKFLLLSQHELNSRIPPEKRVHALVIRLVEEGMAQGRLRRTDPELAVHFLLGIVLQTAIGSVYGYVSRPVSRHLPAIMNAVDRLLSPDGVAVDSP